MASGFDAVNDPDRWRDLNREFPFGAHDFDVVQRLFVTVLFFVRDGISNLELRNRPHLELKGRPRSTNRFLTITIRGVVFRSVRVQFDPKGVLIGDSYVILNGEGAVARLASALVKEAERAWNRYGRANKGSRD
jgi:hypothetical protein